MATRFTALVLAAAAALAPIAAHAQTGGYSAVPAAKPTTLTSFIAGSTPFAWRTDAFVSPRLGDERPAIMCELVAKQVGALSSFRAGGTTLDAAKLEKCNAHAR